MADEMDQQQKIENRHHTNTRVCPACGKRKFMSTTDGLKCASCGFKNIKEQRGKQIVTDKKDFKTFEEKER